MRDQRDGSAVNVLAALAEDQSWHLALTSGGPQLLVSNSEAPVLSGLCVHPHTVHTTTHKLIHINEINLFLCALNVPEYSFSCVYVQFCSMFLPC